MHHPLTNKITPGMVPALAKTLGLFTTYLSANFSMSRSICCASPGSRKLWRNFLEEGGGKVQSKREREKERKRKEIEKKKRKKTEEKEEITNRSAGRNPISPKSIMSTKACIVFTLNSSLFKK